MTAPGGRVVVDADKCTGHGRCYSMYPNIFDCDDEGFGTVVLEQVAPGSEVAEQAADAVLTCPESAIRVDAS